MDEVDYAQANEEIFREAALKSHFRRSGNHLASAEAQAGTGRRPDLGGGHICIDCASIIGSARLAANPAATRCVDCQSDFERRARRG